MQSMTPKRQVTLDDCDQSQVVPSIGCYVKDEVAQEFQVASGSQKTKSQRAKKRPYWFKVAALLVLCMLGLFIGFQRHASSITQVWREVYDLGQKTFSFVSFPIEQVHIVGHQQTPEKHIIEKLGAIWNRSLLSLDSAQVQRDVETLPWVKQAVVERVFPHGLNIYVTERVAIGRWLSNKGRYLFDKQGVMIELTSKDDDLPLPLFEGAGAPKQAFMLKSVVEKFDDLAPLFVRYRRVEGRRWTLILKDGMQIYLPEKQIGRGLSRLRALNVQYNLLSRDLSIIDLRLPDRVTIRPKKGRKLEILSTLEDLEVKGKLTR